MKEEMKENGGYIATFAVEEVEHLAGHDLGVGVLYGLHFTVHHTLVFSLFVNRVNFRDKSTLRQTREEHVLVMNPQEQEYVQIDGKNAHESFDACDFQSEADADQWTQNIPRVVYIRPCIGSLRKTAISNVIEDSLVGVVFAPNEHQMFHSKVKNANGWDDIGYMCAEGHHLCGNSPCRWLLLELPIHHQQKQMITK